jgi:hypothetical protein
MSSSIIQYFGTKSLKSLLLLVTVFLISIINVSSVEAASFSFTTKPLLVSGGNTMLPSVIQQGGGGNVAINLRKSTFSPGETIFVDSSYVLNGSSVRTSFGASHTLGGSEDSIDTSLYDGSLFGQGPAILSYNGVVTFTAPSTAGPYSIQLEVCSWQHFILRVIDENYISLGQPTVYADCQSRSLNFTVETVSLPDNATCGTNSNVPATVSPGQVFPANIHMRNLPSGGANWTATGVYRLKRIGTPDWGPNYISLPGTVPAGSGFNFNGNFTAPMTPDTYDFSWRMDHNGTEFGPTCRESITVVAPAPPPVLGECNEAVTSVSHSSRPSSGSACSVGSPSWTDTTGSNGTYNWNCSGSPAVSCSAAKTPLSCSNEPVPPNAFSWGSGETTNIFSPTPWNHASSPTATKCQFRCDTGAGYEWDSGANACLIPLPPPVPPTGLNATPGACDSGEIILTWNPVPGAVSYRVRLGTGWLATVPTPSLTYTHTVLTPGSINTYYVRTHDGNVPSSNSASATGVAPGVCSAGLEPDLEIGVFDVNEGVPDIISGNYPDAEVRFTIENVSLTVDVSDDIPYLYTVDIGGDDIDVVTYGPELYVGGIGADAASPTLPGNIDVTLPANLVTKVCLRVNLDGPDVIPESNPDTDKNHDCVDFNPGLPEPGITISADDQFVRKGDSTRISWSVTPVVYDLICEVNGPGVTASFNARESYVTEEPTDILNSTSIYTITCGSFPPEDVIVEVIPNFEET